MLALIKELYAIEQKLRDRLDRSRLDMDSPSGVTASAAYYSLLQTAQMNGHDAVRYLSYVFDQVAARPVDAIVDDFLPYLLQPSDY